MTQKNKLLQLIIIIVLITMLMSGYIVITLYFHTDLRNAWQETDTKSLETAPSSVFEEADQISNLNNSFSELGKSSTQADLVGIRNDEGKLLFLHRSKNDTSKGIVYSFSLYMMDSDGSNIIFVDQLRGAPAWSNSGLFFATSCKSDANICIYKSEDLPQNLKVPFALPIDPLLPSYQINLPPECAEKMTGNLAFKSLSWSFDDEKLIVVCKNETDYSTSVCVVDRFSNANCWTEENSNGISYAEFSPVSDQLIVSGTGMGCGSKIYNVDIIGNKISELAVGWGPAWSPDGDQIAFWRNGDTACKVDEDGNFSINYDGAWTAGLAVVDADGSDLKMLSIASDHRNGTFGFFIPDCFLDSCKITWVPEDDSIVFNAGTNYSLDEVTFKYSFETNLVTELLDSNNIYGSNTLFDWGYPVNYSK